MTLGRPRDGAALFEPSTHRAAIDRHAETSESIFLAMERKSIAELVACDVGDK